MKNIKTFASSLCIIAIIALATISCKEEDPMLDSVVSPVLVDIVGAPFGSPIASEPTVTYAATDAKVTLSARLLELDKTNILNNAIGIDSVPVPNVSIKISMRTGASLGDVTSDANGLVKLEKTWSELGIPAAKAGSITKISWSGTYKGIAFTRLSQVQAK